MAVYVGQFWVVVLCDLLKAASSRDSLLAEHGYFSINTILMHLLVNTYIFSAELVCRVFLTTCNATFARFCHE